MFQNTKNSKQQGDVGLGSAIAYYTSLGYTVSIPLNDSQQYDLLVDEEGDIKRVQVKTSYHKTPEGVYRVCLKTSGGNKSFTTIKPFDSKTVELLFVLAEDGSRYSVPTSEFSATNNLNLGKKMEKFKI